MAEESSNAKTEKGPFSSYRLLRDIKYKAEFKNHIH
jgi:hypothetical protein